MKRLTANQMVLRGDFSKVEARVLFVHTERLDTAVRKVAYSISELSSVMGGTGFIHEETAEYMKILSKHLKKFAKDKKYWREDIK